MCASIKYTPPVCDCGEKLIVRFQVIGQTEYPITNKGKLSKRRSFFSYTEEGLLSALYLQCNSCFDRYELMRDSETRIVRGKLDLRIKGSF